MTADSTEPTWKLRKSDTEGVGDGPSWRTQHVKHALQRIEKAPTLDMAATQALTEQVVVLHSIRRILIWTLVLVPLILTALGIILIVSGYAAGSKDCGTYGTLC